MSGQNDPDDEGEGGQPADGQGGDPADAFKAQPDDGQAEQGGQAGQAGQAGQGGQAGQPGQGGQAGQPGQGGQAGQPGQGGQAGQAGQGGQAGQATQAGQQPQGGHGQAPPQAAMGGPSLTDKLQQPPIVDYIKSGVGVYAVTGLGLGIAALIIGILDSDIVEGGLAGGTSTSGVPVTGAVYLAGILAVLFGIRYAERIQEDDQTVAAAVGVTVFAGTIPMWLISGIIGVSQFDNVDLKFGGLFISAIGGAIGVAVVGAGTAYVLRNFEPPAPR